MSLGKLQTAESLKVSRVGFNMFSVFVICCNWHISVRSCRMTQREGERERERKRECVRVCVCVCASACVL
jgi:hypothetical protein